MSDEHAAVILLSARDLAIMKKQLYLSSFVAGRVSLLSNKLLWRFGRLFVLLFFSMKLQFLVF